jgi:hypothetical protein
MKIDGKTIPAPQNIKRREAYLLIHADKLPKTYVQAQLLKIAMTRTEKKLRWLTPDTMLKTADERMKETTKMFTPIPKKQGFISRVKGMFKAQRGN